MDDPLGIYLNDHLAGATAGRDLTRRLASGSPALTRLAAEVDEDRATLVAIMGTLGLPVRRYKVLLGWLAEKAGRFKLNGRIVGRAPLSDLIELEAMLLGVHGKTAGWRTLRARAGTDHRLDAAQLDALIDRATSQLDTLEALRARAVTDAVGGPAPFERHTPG